MSTMQDRLRKYFINYAKKLMLDFESVLDTHSGDLGDNREKGIEIFLRQHLPPVFQVFRGGKVIDSLGGESGGESNQSDIIICNSFIPQIRTNQKTVYFVEGVMGVVECKSTLSKKELRDCIQKCRQLKTLQKVPEYRNEVFYDINYSYKLNKAHFSIVAYDSSSIDTIANNLLSINKELGIEPTSEVDCVCIIKKGIIFKPAYPGLEGCLQYVPQGARSYICKASEFESLAYFLIQLQREFQYIRHISFDMTKYLPTFVEGWHIKFSQ